MDTCNSRGHQHQVCLVDRTTPPPTRCVLSRSAANSPRREARTRDADATRHALRARGLCASAGPHWRLWHIPQLGRRPCQPKRGSLASRPRAAPAPALQQRVGAQRRTTSVVRRFRRAVLRRDVRQGLDGCNGRRPRSAARPRNHRVQLCALHRVQSSTHGLLCPNGRALLCRQGRRRQVRSPR